MTRFEILDITLENIKTYTYEEIKFSKGNNVLIGENGAGKSTILESIYLSLFGETVSSRNLADMVRFGEKMGRIEIRFSVDETLYRITDEITKSDINRATQKQILFNETLEETIAEGKKAVKLKIEEILNSDSTTYISAVYASQGEIGQIVTAKDKDRKKLFDRLFQIERFEKTWSNLAKVEKVITNKITTSEKEIEILEDEVIEFPEIKEQLKKKKSQLKSEKSKLKEIQKKNVENKKLYDQIEKMIVEYQNLDGEKSASEKSIKDYKTQLKQKISNLNKEYKNEEINNDLKALKKKNLELNKKIKDLELVISKLHEEEKKAKVDFERLKNLENNISELENTIHIEEKESSNEIRNFKELIPDLPEKIVKWELFLKEKLAEKKEELKKGKAEIDKIRKIAQEITNLETKIESLKNSEIKYDSRIVRKRLILSKEAGDDWINVVKEYSKIDFEKNLTNLNKGLEKYELEHMTLSKEKSVIDDKIKRVTNDIKHLDEIHDKKTCPTCRQILSEQTLEKLISTLKNERKEAKDEKKILAEKIQKITKRITKLKEQEKDQSKKKQLFDKITPTYNDLKDLEKEKKEVLEEKNLLLKNLDKKKESYIEDEMLELEQKNSSLDSTLHNLRHAINSISKLSRKEVRIKELKSDLQKKEKQLVNLKKTTNEQKISDIEKNLTLEEKEKESILTLKNEIGDLITIKTSLEKEEKNIDNIKEKILDIKKQENFKNWEKIKKTKAELNSTISSKKTLIKNLKEEIIPPLNERITSLDKKQKRLEKVKADLNLELKKRKISSILRGLMRELPNRLLPNFIERINRTATDILQSIIPASDIQSIVLNDDYSLNVVRLGNIENISVLSGGETIIIALALRLAFAKEFSTLDSLILDEPTIFLDERRRNELVKVLEQNRLVSQMFVVTHDPDFERISDKTYIVSKENGNTTVNPITDSSNTSNQKLDLDS